MIKVRIQLKSEAGGNVSPLAVAKEIYAEGGIGRFYRGYINEYKIIRIDSALMR